MTSDITTTEHDVFLDVFAALEMYEGTCGSDGTTIEAVEETSGDSTLRVKLTNGDTYLVRVRAEEVQA